MEGGTQECQFTKQTKGLCAPDQTLGRVEELRVPRKNRDLQRTQEGCLIMNERNLRILCETDGLYEYPEMNKKLYLHYKVIDRLYGLDQYVNLKTLYLENNVIKKIQNLGHLAELENLFLQNNMISQIEGLEQLKQLKVINLANNTIFQIQGLAQCTLLQSLTLSHNYLNNFDSLEHLGQCSNTLTSIDLSQNKITADERIFNLIPQVKLLYLGGNPLVRETNHYRRTVIGKLPALLYLDQRGVDQEERMLAESWVNEGEAGFKATKAKIMCLRREKREQARKQIMANIDVHRKKKINVFESNILEAEKQIEKLRRYMREPGSQDQIFFHQGRIAELMQKIRQNQQFIDSLYKRMGFEPLPPVYSLELDPEKRDEDQRENMRRGQMFDIRQEADELQSEGQSEGQSEEGSVQSRAPSQQSGSSGALVSNSSQPSSLQTYNSYEDLD